MTTEVIEKIKKQLADNTVILYMKGSPQFPMCGFSARVVHVLAINNAKYSYINILENSEIRKILPEYSSWPTYPQLYVNQELIGGCDIIMDLQEDGGLSKILQDAQAISSTNKVEITAA